MGHELDGLAADIATHLGYYRVEAEGGGCPLPYSCTDIILGQEAGGDPTEQWRENVRRAQARRCGEAIPPTVAATFVFGWYLQLAAIPAAFAAVLRTWIPDVAPDALRFDLHADEHYPVSLSLGGVPGPELPFDVEHRLDFARRAYENHADRFADSYRPGIKMSSRQRRGLVHDTWVALSDSARTTVLGERSRLGPRESCCFLFAVPNAPTCERCPRLRRR